MSLNHEIVVSNFKSGEIVHYPVIIVKGFVKSTTECKNQLDKICVNSDLFQISNGKFKALVELQIGQNTIGLVYCCVKATISLNYRRKSSKYSVLPLYIICEGHDGRFQAPEAENDGAESARKRISLGAKLLQSAIAEKLYEKNLGRKTFQLEGDCEIFHSNLDYLKARKMSQEALWNHVGSEIINLPRLDHERIKFLGFLSCTKYCGEHYRENFRHEDILGITEAYVALGGGGLALFGTACLYTWPESLSRVIENFENVAPIDRRNFMDDSNYRGTLGACFSTTLGSALHELCHTFDLGHTELGIMGRGFDDIYKVFTVAEDVRPEENSAFWTKSCLFILAYHRWINDLGSCGNKAIKFDPISRFISSSSGLRVVELRRQEDGMVVSDWVFDSRILKYSFQLSEELSFGQNSIVVFVEDNSGNVFKYSLNEV